MTLTVVFEDGVIIKNKKALHKFIFENFDPNWRVIQWHDDHGWIEVHNGDRIWLETIDIVQPYIDMWEEKNINL